MPVKGFSMLRRSTLSLPTRDERLMRRLALVCWAVLLTAVAGRLLLERIVQHSVYSVFESAGRNWIDGRPLYGNPDSLFRYSPIVAAAFAPWTLLPPRAAEILWRIGSAAAFLAALFAFLRTCVPAIDARGRWAVLLGSLPLGLMSVNNGQANILLGALLFFALADAARERWNRCAAALAAAVLLKLWPIAAAGLLIVAFPGGLAPRFIAWIAAGLAAPFLFQRWDYVVAAYQSWFAYLPSDTRIDFNLLDGNRDFWLVNKLVGQPLASDQYHLLQLATAGALAATVAWLRRRVAGEHVLAFIAFAGTIWMLGFGPATESCTYSLMGPLLAWAWVDPARSNESRVEHLLLLLSSALFGIALVWVATPYSRLVEAFGLQPLGAGVLLFRLLIAGRPIGVFCSVRDSFPRIAVRRRQTA
jgi:hypothetical protein